MHAGGGEREDRVARFEIGARQKLGALHRANRESSEVVIAGGVEPRHLGGLAADQRASGLAAAFGNAGNDALGNTDIELAGSEIVEKEERLGALHHEIVDVHGDEIDADAVMGAGLDGELELGADAVGGGDEERVLEAARLEVEQAAEPADAAQKAGARGPGGERADRVHQRIASIDIDAGVAVGERGLVLGFRGHPGALGREAGFKRFGISSG